MLDSNLLVDYLAVQSLQLFFVFLLALTASWLLRRCSAHLRYWLWLLVIAKCVTPPIIGLPVPVAISEPPSPGTERVENADTPASRTSRPQIPTPRSLAPDAVDARVRSHTPGVSDSKQMPTDQTDFDALAFLAAVWSVVALLMLTYTAVQAWRIERRLRRERVAASDDLKSAVLQVASNLSMRRLPHVFLAASATQPFVWGWFRGNIYLPESFTSLCNQEQRRAIIAHELAHVSRCDVAVNLLQVVVQSAFFFHPVVWWTNGRIRQEREKCCDEVVLSGQQTHPRTYCEAIFRMLATHENSLQGTPALAVTGSTKAIEDRLSTILAPRKFYRRLTPSSLTALAILAGCFLPVGFVFRAVASPQSEDNVDRTAWKIQVQVVDGDGRPVANSKIGVQNGANVDPIWQDGDHLGTANVRFDTRTPAYVYLLARAPGFAPMRAFWRNRADQASDPLPLKFRFTMVRAATVGGIVRDEEGNGVAGATVRFSAALRSEDNATRAQVSFHKEVYTTDEEGRWTCDLAPESMNSCSINVYHDEYVYYPHGSGLDHAISSLLAHSHEYTLKKGFSISGRAVDEEGNPVKGAILGIGEFNASSHEGPFRRTDSDGAYRFEAVSPRSDGHRDDPISFTLTILKKGFQPVIQRVPGYGKRSMEGSTEDERVVDFVLRRGIPFTLKVVDVDGQPIRGVHVVLWNWRDTVTLAQLQKSILPITTDEEGTWSWDNFPRDESIKLDLFKSGFADVRRYDVEAKGNAIARTVVLKRPQIITGTVIDSITKQPIPEFVVQRAFEGMAGLPDGLWWVDPTRARNGQYRKKVTMPPSNGSYTYRVLADGYEVSTSESTTYEEGDTTVLNFELVPKK